MQKNVPQKVKQFASDNRKNMPPAEVLLWLRFRTWRSEGIVIRRQHSISSYIADFACIHVNLTAHPTRAKKNTTKPGRSGLKIKARR